MNQSMIIYDSLIFYYLIVKAHSEIIVFNIQYPNKYSIARSNEMRLEMRVDVTG